LLEALAKGRQKRLENIRERNISNVSIGPGKKQPVLKLDKDGTILEQFESIKHASEKLGLLPNKISAVCRGERNMTGGFGWKYADDHKNRNKSTGELYITKQGNGYMLRITKATYKIQKWFKTLEDAIEQRNICISEME
jgi:hypothetical protein